MPGQHIIKFFIYLAAVSCFYIVWSPVMNLLSTSVDCGGLTDCSNMLGYLNTLQPFFLFIALVLGVIWLLVKGINASDRDVPL